LPGLQIAPFDPVSEIFILFIYGPWMGADYQLMNRGKIFGSQVYKPGLGSILSQYRTGSSNSHQNNGQNFIIKIQIEMLNHAKAPNQGKS